MDTSRLNEPSGNTLYEMRGQDYDTLLRMPGNSVCVDCGKARPDWGSPKLGVLFCTPCSGHHRGLGTHISFVRSVHMDSWTEQQLGYMKMGGNERLNKYLKEHGIAADAPHKQKYDNDIASLYRLRLKARVEGKQEPTELPKTQPQRKKDLSKLQGFGSSPPPPPPPKVQPVVVVVVAVALAAAGGALYFS